LAPINPKKLASVELYKKGMYESIAKKSLMDALQQVANEQIKKHKIETCSSVKRGRFYTQSPNIT
jgi:hypothetical protein